MVMVAELGTPLTERGEEWPQAPHLGFQPLFIPTNQLWELSDATVYKKKKNNWKWDSTVQRSWHIIHDGVGPCSDVAVWEATHPPVSNPSLMFL